MSSVPERRLRRHAARAGLRLERSNAQTDANPERGLYRLADVATGALVAGFEPGGLAYGLTLDEAVAYVAAYKAPMPKVTGSDRPVTLCEHHPSGG